MRSRLNVGPLYVRALHIRETPFVPSWSLTTRCIVQPLQDSQGTRDHEDLAYRSVCLRRRRHASVSPRRLRARSPPASALDLSWLSNDNYVRCLKYVSGLAHGNAGPHTTVAAGLATGSIIRAGRATITEPSNTSNLANDPDSAKRPARDIPRGFPFAELARKSHPPTCGQGKIARLSIR